MHRLAWWPPSVLPKCGYTFRFNSMYLLLLLLLLLLLCFSLRKERVLMSIHYYRIAKWSQKDKQVFCRLLLPLGTFDCSLRNFKLFKVSLCKTDNQLLAPPAWHAWDNAFFWELQGPESSCYWSNSIDGIKWKFLAIIFKSVPELIFFIIIIMNVSSI